MGHAYERLAAVLADQPGALARISVFSDSINGTEFITSAIRRYLQQRLGDGGKGFVPIAPGWPTQRHQDVVWNDYGTWLTEIVNRGRLATGRYGLGGVVARNRSIYSRATFATVEGGTVGTRVSRFQLFYQAHPRGGEVQLSVDGGEPRVIATRADGLEDRVAELEVADGAHELEVRAVDGQLQLYGVVLERSGPGVVVDGLMLIGARGRRMALFDEEHLGRQVALRGTDLLVFWMGGNDVSSGFFDRDLFLRDYGAGIDAARAGRAEASCLVVSVLDMGVRPGGRTRRRVPRFIEIQHELALSADAHS